MTPRLQRKSYIIKIFLDDLFVLICHFPRANYHLQEEISVVEAILVEVIAGKEHTTTVVVVATETIEEIVTIIDLEAAMIAMMTDVAMMVDETAVVTEIIIVAIDHEVKIEDEGTGIDFWNQEAEIALLLMETMHNCIQIYSTLN